MPPNASKSSNSSVSYALKFGLLNSRSIKFTTKSRASKYMYVLLNSSLAYQTLFCNKYENRNSSIVTRNIHCEILLEYRAYVYN